MMRELLISVVSGIVVAMILGMFRMGGGRPPEPRQSVRYHEAAPQRRGGGFFGGLMRFILSVAGGLALAYAARPFILGRHYDRFDRFDGFRDLTSHAPMLILTIVATIIVWSLLSAMTRR